MRKFFLLIFIFVFSGFCFAQKKNKGNGSGFSLGSIFAQKDRAHAKYFIGLSYGGGKAWWHSSLVNSEIYDIYGNVVRSGNIDFHANNQTNSICLDGMVPIGHVRFGLGIEFNYFFLDKLQLLDPGRSPQYVIYPETFRFDQFYASCEVPLNFTSDKFYTFSLRAHLGYFGFSFVDHFSLFGDNALAKTFFGAVGFLTDFKLYPHSYFFIFPNFEYKYYNNNDSENPVQITHHIFELNCKVGIRIDVSKEK